MPDFNVRSDSVNVEQIMEQIRGRIREKRGVDYTEQQIRELAEVKLEKFLDPRGVRSDLLEQFRKAQPRPEQLERPNFAFEDATLFESHRGAIRWIRKLLAPILKLFFNPNPLIQALHIQARLNTINAERETAQRAMDQLYYELIHNLVVEATRLGIEVKNLKMRVESVSSRLEFNERRARALESAVVYRPSAIEEPVPQRPLPQPAQHQRYTPPPRQHTPPPQQQAAPPAVHAPVEPDQASGAAANTPGATGQVEGPGQRSRRRRRRRGRRSGAGTGAPGVAGAAADQSGASEGAEPTDPIDRLDDDEPAETTDAPPMAADNVEQALTAQVQRIEPIAEAPAAPLAPVATPQPDAPSSADSTPHPPSGGSGQTGSDPDAQ